MKLNIFNLKMKLCCHKFGEPCNASVELLLWGGRPVEIQSPVYIMRRLEYLYLISYMKMLVSQIFVVGIAQVIPVYVSLMTVQILYF